ncbi:hypothetical protein LJC45_00660 [Alistipes sp. OttesenSCG-928-B03]|nr:hypothetical protein [Alistipes sp. OttesenSCG-928-B03]
MYHENPQNKNSFRVLNSKYDILPNHSALRNNAVRRARREDNRRRPMTFPAKLPTFVIPQRGGLGIARFCMAATADVCATGGLATIFACDHKNI